MKKFLANTAFGLLLAGSLFLIACGGNQSNGDASGPHGEGPAFTSEYVCPMHCEGSGSDAAGKCPKCGMDYVAQAEHVGDGHTH